MRHSLLICAILLAISPAGWALEVTVKGLFQGGAILEVDGKRRMLRTGQRSPEGVLLVSADMKQAVLEIDGKQEKLGISRSISNRYQERSKPEVRIASGEGGHYFTPGRINGQAVDFLVDTGATAVAMNLPTAQRLGLNYRAGQRVSVSTASGVDSAYRVVLDSVRVGTIEVRNVEAVVSMGDFPREILLGNSYLNRVGLRREAGVLILEAQY
ncbi:retropepsin-like aspartic protease family protein [Gilvimarinus sp. F26214L]|uniref:retropepsin-like aspartic protease family protein n=1 Tax=Gilvimarinus sp. DZF01 TaxID=3461371 RepID=UPI004045E54B